MVRSCILRSASGTRKELVSVSMVSMRCIVPAVSVTITLRVREESLEEAIDPSGDPKHQMRRGMPNDDRSERCRKYQIDQHHDSEYLSERVAQRDDASCNV